MEIRHAHSEELADVEQQRPMLADTLLNVGSVSKTVTCTAVMQLWEQNRFGLQDARSRSMALVWQLGRACMAMSLVTIFCAVEVYVVNSTHSDLTTEHDRSFVGIFIATTIFLIGIGFALRRYSIRKEGSTDALH